MTTPEDDTGPLFYSHDVESILLNDGWHEVKDFQTADYEIAEGDDDASVSIDLGVPGFYATDVLTELPIAGPLSSVLAYRLGSNEVG